MNGKTVRPIVRQEPMTFWKRYYMAAVTELPILEFKCCEQEALPGHFAEPIISGTLAAMLKGPRSCGRDSISYELN